MKHSQAKLNHLAHHDALTDLPNRLLLSARLEHCVERARRDRDQVAILFLDLDDFKQINDSLGHPVGDKVLTQVAARLFSRVREDDTVARLGGDEFVIVMGQIDTARKAALLAEELLAEISRPVHVDRQELFVTGSIGISIFPQDGADIATLLRNADTAMYRAKEEARNSYQFYTTHFTTDAFERMRLQTDLRRALENQEFEVYYQMQTEVASGRIIGAEALVRWQHPEMGLVTPASFINLAEQTGQITALGEWVLRQACEQWVAWEKQGLLLEHIAVNLSGRQIHQPGLVDQVQRILADTGCPPQHLELEVSEGYIMSKVASAQTVLNGLRALGVSLAIDDFGTGYSSLAYLKRLPIGKLKIDRTFVRDIPLDPEDAAITRAIIALGKSLRLEVIAEGVENEAQLNFLNHESCDQIQGYLHGHPAPPEQFEQQLVCMGIEQRPRTSELLI
ncbi:MAG: EAL domain-containing protein [Gammaproteobacteria bacterium]|nr:EAL domain-containing protein [Gammaproteobacteria bacterium]